MIQAKGDADVDITKAAVDTVHSHSTTLIREDTDLLILLLHYSNVDGKPLYGIRQINNINIYSCMHLWGVIQYSVFLVLVRNQPSKNLQKIALSLHPVQICMHYAWQESQ